MKRKSSMKISILLAIMVFITSFQGLTFGVFAAEKSEPILIENAGNIKNIVRFGASYGSYITSPDVSGAPTNDIVGADCTGDPKNIGAFGIRNNADGQFGVSAANSYVTVSYYIMASGGENSVNAVINDTDAGKNYYADGDFLKSETTLEAGVWYKVIQIFKIENAGTNNLRLVVNAGNVGQKTYIGGVKVYNFGTEYTADEIKSYAAEASLNGITNGGAPIDGFDKNTYNYNIDSSLGINATANVLCDIYYDNSVAGKTVITAKTYEIGKLNTIPKDTKVYTVSVKEMYKSMLSETYAYGTWTMADVNHRGASRPEIVKDSEKEFAMKFWGNDANYTDSEKGKSIFRGQLSNSYVDGSEYLKNGDKIYISFYAKAYSKYGNECKVKPALQSESSAGGGLNTSYNGDDFTLSGVWKKYSTVITINKDQADGSVGTRVTLALGYYGQITYISDFEIYKCDSSLTDNEIKALFENGPANLIGTYALIRAGASYGDSPVNEDVSGQPFETSQKFAAKDTNSAIGQYNARISTANINNNLIFEDDVILLTYWAKAEISTAGSTPQIVPTLQFQDANDATKKTLNHLKNDGTVDASPINLTGEWKRYAYVFSMADKGDYNVRLQLQIGLAGQTTHIADLMLYNLGNVSVSDAYAILRNNDILGATYSTRTMQNVNGTYTAKLAKDETFDLTKVNVYAKYPFVYADAADGKITAISADGTKNIYDIKTENAAKEIWADEIKYYARSSKNVIYRLDDLIPSNITEFEYVAEYLHKKGLTATFGIIGQNWENASESDWNTIKKWQDEYGIELFCHGYEHSEAEFSTAAYNAQYNSLDKYIKLFNAHGIATKTFGSPFNNSTAVTSSALNALGIENNLFGINTTFENLINYTDRCNIETETGVADFNAFETNIKNFENADCIVIQGHAAVWNENSKAAFEKSVEYLSENGYNFITPNAYHIDVKSKTEAGSVRAGNISAEIKLCSGSLAAESATLILAVYDNDGELKDIAVKNVSLDTKEEEFISLTAKAPSDGCSAKVFVWKDTSSMFPIQIADKLK